MKLCAVRTTMDDELHTLTENLFEEAYKMVDTAKEEKGQAVKKLADAAGKIDAMETEMFALKNLLHTPSAGPTLTLSHTPSPTARHRKPNVKKVNSSDKYACVNGHVIRHYVQCLCHLCAMPTAVGMLMLDMFVC